MTDRVRIDVDGTTIEAAVGTTVAVALLNAGITRFRTSVTGRPRAPVCGMGTCFECRVTIDDQPDQRSCQTPCVAGMKVVTGDAS